LKNKATKKRVRKGTKMILDCGRGLSEGGGGEERKLVAQEIPPHLSTSQRWIDFLALKWMMYRLLAQV
jgi:hypothetical protein